MKERVVVFDPGEKQYCSLKIEVDREDTFSVSGVCGNVYTEEQLEAYVEEWWSQFETVEDLEEEFGICGEEGLDIDSEECEEALEAEREYLKEEYFPEEVHKKEYTDGGAIFFTVWSAGQNNDTVRKMPSVRKDLDKVLHAWDSRHLKKIPSSELYEVFGAFEKFPTFEEYAKEIKGIIS